MILGSSYSPTTANPVRALADDFGPLRARNGVLLTVWDLGENLDLVGYFVVHQPFLPFGSNVVREQLVVFCAVVNTITNDEEIFRLRCSCLARHKLTCTGHGHGNFEALDVFLCDLGPCAP